jgi:hypothetical protein
MFVVGGVRLYGVYCLRCESIWNLSFYCTERHESLPSWKHGIFLDSQMIDMFERLCKLQALGTRKHHVLSSVTVRLLLSITKIQ